MQHFVYIHTCPNGKKYIGVTIQNPEIRWCNGKGYRQNKHFYRAIKKYGWDNIEHEVFETESIGLMSYWERILIHHYNTMNPDFGYNNTSGGERINGCYFSDETRKKISESMKGHKISKETKEKLSKVGKGKKRKPCSDETKKKISEANKGNTSPNKGKKLSEETRKKISEARKGKPLNRKGYIHSEETRKKISEAVMGRIPWNKGLKKEVRRPPLF